jgi:hypothetical protein
MRGLNVALDALASGAAWTGSRWRRNFAGSSQHEAWRS